MLYNLLAGGGGLYLCQDPNGRLNEDERSILKRLHQKCRKIQFDLLNGGYTQAKVMLVKAMAENRTPLEPTIVKIASKAELEKEITLYALTIYSKELEKEITFDNCPLIRVPRSMLCSSQAQGSPGASDDHMI